MEPIHRTSRCQKTKKELNDIQEQSDAVSLVKKRTGQRLKQSLGRWAEMFFPRQLKSISGDVVFGRRRPHEPSHEERHLHTLISPILYSINFTGPELGSPDEVHPSRPQTRQRPPRFNRTHQVVRFWVMQTHRNQTQKTSGYPCKERRDGN